MRLGIDLDGVVANFTKGWMWFYNREFGAELSVEDSRRWNDLVDLTHFADIDEFWQWSSDLDGRSVFWHLEPFPGAVEALDGLAEEGHEIVVVTTKPAFAVDDTHEWIERHGIPAERDPHPRGQVAGSMPCLCRRRTSHPPQARAASARGHGVPICPSLEPSGGRSHRRP
jgi:hypothetical protein